MKLSTKILVGVSVLVGIVLARGLIEYRQAVSAQRELAMFELSTLRKTALASQLEEALTRLEVTLLLNAPLDRIESDQPTITHISSLLTNAIDVQTTDVSAGAGPGEASGLNNAGADLLLLKTLEAQFAVVQGNWQRLTAVELTAPARSALATQSRETLQLQVKPSVGAYRDKAINALIEKNHEFQDRSVSAFLWVLGAALALIVIGLGARYWLLRTVMVPLEKVVEATNDIIAGNLDRRLPDHPQEEFARIAHSFNRMLDNLAATSAARDQMRRQADENGKDLDDFFNASIDSLLITNAEGHFLRVNSAFCQLLGYAPAELLNRHFNDFIHPDDQESCEQEMARLNDGLASHDFENRQVRKDGTVAWLSWRTQANTQSGHVHAIGRDITTKKNVEQALAESQAALGQLNDKLEDLVTHRTQKLHESEERFRRLVDGVRDYAIFMCDANGRIVSWNHGAARLHGYGATEIIGEHFSTFYRTAEIRAGKPAHVLEVAETSGRYEETGRRTRKNGEDFLAHVVITAVRDEEGVLQGFANISRDITDQQRNIDHVLEQKELFRLLMENLTEGVVACNARGKLTFVNKTAREWYGIDVMTVPEAEWSQSFHLFAANGTTPLESASTPLMRATRGESVRNAEITIARQGAPRRHIVASGDVVKDADGHHLGAVVAMHDITDRRNAERHNLRTQRLESIGTLSGGIAHDLNNALAPILMGIELLKSRYPDSSSFLNSMETSARRGASMVKQLLTFAKGVDGQRVPLQSRHLVDEIQSIIERTFPKNIELAVELGPELYPIVGDATQIHQVLLNLCVNARDAMPAGGLLKIEVHNHVVDELYASNIPDLKLGPHVLLKISDTGTGMSPEVIERIFEPFFSTKPADLGTGLGLSTVIGIVRSHKGCVHVYSQPDKGTTFAIYLPKAEEESPLSAPPFLPSINFAGDHRSILIVEDEPAVREIARAVLTSLDFQVFTATDGEAAITQMAHGLTDLSLIITDLHMPKMDGLAFVRRVRELMPEVPFIVSSGRMEKKDAEVLLLLGVKHLLQKPFSQGDLVAALQRVFSQNSAQPFLTTTIAHSESA